MCVLFNYTIVAFKDCIKTNYEGGKKQRFQSLQSLTSILYLLRRQQSELCVFVHFKGWFIFLFLVGHINKNWLVWLNSTLYTVPTVYYYTAHSKDLRGRDSFSLGVCVSSSTIAAKFAFLLVVLYLRTIDFYFDNFES